MDFDESRRTSKVKFDLRRETLMFPKDRNQTGAKFGKQNSDRRYSAVNASPDPKSCDGRRHSEIFHKKRRPSEVLKDPSPPNHHVLTSHQSNCLEHDRRLQTMLKDRRYSSEKIYVLDVVSFGKSLRTKSVMAVVSLQKHGNVTAVFYNKYGILSPSANRARFQATSGPKRFSEGDVQEAQHLHIPGLAGPRGHNKFKNVASAAVFR